MIPEQLSRPICGNSLYASMPIVLFRLIHFNVSLAPRAISSASLIGSVPLTKLQPNRFFTSPAFTKSIGSKWWTGFTVIRHEPPPFGKYLMKWGELRTVSLGKSNRWSYLPASHQIKIECCTELFQILSEYFGGEIDLWCHFTICAATQMQHRRSITEQCGGQCGLQ